MLEQMYYYVIIPDLVVLRRWIPLNVNLAGHVGPTHHFVHRLVPNGKNVPISLVVVGYSLTTKADGDIVTTWMLGAPSGLRTIALSLLKYASDDLMDAGRRPLGSSNVPVRSSVRSYF